MSHVRAKRMKAGLPARLGTVIFLVSLSSGPVVAQEHHQSSRERLLRRESPERVQRMQVTRVVEALHLGSGQTVADIGAGSGLFSRPIARAVGESGRVFAVDIDSGALQYIDETAREQKLPQIQTVLAEEADPKIPEPVDLIVIIDTLHHVPDLPAYVEALHRYLKPGGRIAVVDFTEQWPRAFESRKYTVSDLDGWMARIGLTRQQRFDFIDNHFFAIYK